MVEEIVVPNLGGGNEEYLEKTTNLYLVTEVDVNLSILRPQPLLFLHYNVY